MPWKATTVGFTPRKVARGGGLGPGEPRVAAEDLHRFAVRAQLVDDIGHRGVLAMAFDVDQEDVLPMSRSFGARFDARKVETFTVEDLEHAAKSAAGARVGERESERGLVGPGAWSVL